MYKELKGTLGEDAFKAIWIHLIEFIWYISFGIYLVLQFEEGSAWTLAFFMIITLIVFICGYYLKKQIYYEERTKGTKFNKLVIIMDVFMILCGFTITIYINFFN